MLLTGLTMFVTTCMSGAIFSLHGRWKQPRPQANSRYPSDRRRLGTKPNSDNAWHKMAKKSQFSEKKTQILLKKTCFFL